MTRVATSAAVLALVLAAAGCGGGGGASEDDVSHKADLTVTVWPNGLGGDEVSWRLECDPVGGDHPDGEAACATLDSLKDPFGNPKPTPRCDEIPGATPDVARIEGTFRGKQVDAMFDRANGCHFERWDRLGPVFPTGF
jgi:hypothetical protein